MASKMDTARNDTKVKKDMACKMTEAKLSALFNVTYYTRLCRDHLKPLLTGFKAGLLNDFPPQDYDILCNHFSALITRTPSTAATVPVPPILEQLFETLEDIPSTINLFTNGAGKSFMANLLLLPRGERMSVPRQSIHNQQPLVWYRVRRADWRGRPVSLQWCTETGGRGGEGAEG